MKEIFFAGLWLQRGSMAYELHQEAKSGAKDGWKKLDMHLKQLDAQERRLQGDK